MSCIQGIIRIAGTIRISATDHEKRRITIVTMEWPRMRNCASDDVPMTAKKKHGYIIHRTIL